MPGRLILTAILLAVPGTAALAQTALSGEALFQTRCATCHSAARVVRPLRDVAAPERRARLDAFLRSHHTIPAERDLLVDYLLSLAAR